MWKLYSPLMRADFQFFDEYAHAHAGARPLDVPIAAFHAARDRTVTRAMVAAWRGLTAGAFAEHPPLDGNHLFVYDEAARERWFALLTVTLSDCRRQPGRTLSRVDDAEPKSPGAQDCGGCHVGGVLGCFGL